MSAVVSQGMHDPSLRLFPTSRTFINPLFDYCVIGGGLSLIVLTLLSVTGQLSETSVSAHAMPYFVLASNSAHFAASSVRLYSKPGAVRDWPFLTLGLPIVTLAVLAIALLSPRGFGIHLNALYLTWSPFHYAAQAFGLACMYHYRSGGKLSESDRNLLYATCLLPFVYAFIFAEAGGLAWFVPAAWFESNAMQRPLAFAHLGITFLVFAAPVALAARRHLNGEQGLPLISWLIVVTNGAWWVIFNYFEAFAWATVFHGVQYLAIVMIFHVKDRKATGADPRNPLVIAFRFYAVCLGLGFLLFNVWPFAFQLSGFGLAESMLLCVAVINIHHFIVDRYIWRLRRDPSNEVSMRS